MPVTVSTPDDLASIQAEITDLTTQVSGIISRLDDLTAFVNAHLQPLRRRTHR